MHTSNPCELLTAIIRVGSGDLLGHWFNWLAIFFSALWVGTFVYVCLSPSPISGEELVRLLLNHPHVELVAATSRQNSGQTLAQVFPKFASHSQSKTLRFTEPNAELLAKRNVFDCE